MLVLKILPLVFMFLTLLNVGQVVVKLSDGSGQSVVGVAFTALFWLGLSVVSVRGIAAQKKKKDIDPPQGGA